ncbi:crinkler (CRN) family protein, putative [Phytophthora infestans T30-4]|uniref:Crinkler (CRN) family protein, putative n=1 Tax=Phytophthora infestans (strain T30-4) TaxID=403677 RepID=D0NJ12_PHYIT|nr:crinkler (CRN) family protein, putative [Phytophthora infestans T30-4]EEY59530.1 crinkler (CRN) family protein, putative [Phytophthora infestans T30-4]|eukprot:XP_002900723.1 crinkler (CRN) family protein, putative [Phytophthora infestans T30-4]
MVTLYCAVVGVAGSAFPVDIDESKSVGHLKDAIKEKSASTITCDAIGQHGDQTPSRRRRRRVGRGQTDAGQN